MLPARKKCFERNSLDKTLGILGWHYSSEGSIPLAGFPDYTLFLNEDDKQAALSKTNGGLEFFRHAVAICEAKPWDEPLLAKNEKEKQSPRGQVYGYLEATHCRLGIVTNGRHWMLVCRDYSRAQQRDYSVDLDLLLTRPTWSPEFNLFYLFFRRESIADGFLARALDESRVNGPRGCGKRDERPETTGWQHVLPRRLYRSCAPIVENPGNRGQPWAPNDYEVLRRRFIELRRQGTPKGRAIDILGKELGRGRFSLMKAIDRMEIADPSLMVSEEAQKKLAF